MRRKTACEEDETEFEKVEYICLGSGISIRDNIRPDNTWKHMMLKDVVVVVVVVMKKKYKVFEESHKRTRL